MGTRFISQSPLLRARQRGSQQLTLPRQSMVATSYGVAPMSNLSLDVRYDRASDVLYISRRKGSSLLSRHGNDPSLIWRFDRTTGEVVGVTVRHFAAYWRPKLDELADQIAYQLALP